VVAERKSLAEIRSYGARLACRRPASVEGAGGGCANVEERAIDASSNPIAAADRMKPSVMFAPSPPSPVEPPTGRIKANASAA
jgi:hypothetical protein